MYAWLKRANPSLGPSTTPGLPNPMETKNPRGTAAANREVEKVIAESFSPSRKRKRGSYGHYSPEMRAKIAKMCINIGASKTARRMSVEVGQQLNESTVRSIKNSYSKELGRLNVDNVENLPRKNTGRPLLLGDLDEQLKEYTHGLRRAGGVVNRDVVMGAARGFVIDKDRSLLAENGGHIRLTKEWANSFLSRMNFVRRKGTKAARKIPEDFEELRDAFHGRIEEVVKENNIPDQLVINWDQTGINVVPVGGWTLAEEGSRQVPIVGLEDKRQITCLLSINLSGQLLPPQVLYQGKTPACHPKFTFPPEWDIHHSESHWSNASTMDRYADKVLVPYVKAQREFLGLGPDQPALAIFDVYKAHRCPALLKKLKDNNIHAVFVPASCTGELQPLDCDGGVNDVLKKELKQRFVQYYADTFVEEMRQGRDLASIKIELTLSKLKPLHANWLLGAMDGMSNNIDALRRGWDRTGIRAVVDKARE